MFELKFDRQQITIEGTSYTKENILSGKPAFACQSVFGNEVYMFLLEWFSLSDNIILHTSGSTGEPKEIIASKSRMMQSAILTCSYLGLKAGDKALLCLPVSAIAGKMMLVRALVAGLDIYLVPPCGNPLKNIDSAFQFAAMVPLQVFNSLQNPIEKERLKAIDNLIIGGAAIDSQLETALSHFPNNIYSTYGMTETLSHIALRRLNGDAISKNYIPFPSVQLSLSEDDCLIIDTPLICEEQLYTNDIATINPDGSFRISGRKDNVINSGGVKIQIEALENKLRAVIDCPFAITSRSNAKFGEIAVLVSEKPIDESQFAGLLEPYEIPKEIIVVKSIPQTITSKIDRKAVRNIVKK